MQIRPCILIPIYNNRDTIRSVVEAIGFADVPCLIVNDGSNAATRDELNTIDQDFDWVEVMHRDRNGGKGAAMRDGFALASERGYTHAIQMDADGQHEAADIPRFLDEAREHPDALILSDPVFDADAPKARVYGRLVTTYCVWLETLSTQIRDTLCGYRCYPLEPVMRCYRKTSIGNGMVFDTEIAVHLYWQGTPTRSIKTQVHYASGGMSHFDYLSDNLKISWMHIRLIAGMLLRIPRLLRLRTR